MIVACSPRPTKNELAVALEAYRIAFNFHSNSLLACHSRPAALQPLLSNPNHWNSLHFPLQRSPRICIFVDTHSSEKPNCFKRSVKYSTGPPASVCLQPTDHAFVFATVYGRFLVTASAALFALLY